MVGWRGRAFVWVFDSEGGYRNLDELSNGDPSRMATIGLFDAIKEWRAQAEVVERHTETVSRHTVASEDIYEATKALFRRRLDAIADPSGLGTIERYDIVEDQPGKVGIHVLGHRKAGDFWIMVEEAGEDAIEVYAYGETGKVYTSFLEGEEAAEEILRETEDLLDRNRVYLS